MLTSCSSSGLLLLRCLLLSFLTAFALRTRLSALNRRNAARVAALSKDEKARMDEQEDSEVWDDDPRYVFMT
jgi:hypothetical protein